MPSAANARLRETEFPELFCAPRPARIRGYCAYARVSLKLVPIVSRNTVDFAGYFARGLFTVRADTASLGINARPERGFSTACETR